ncbi:hypothetical protein Adt_35567 [Abeliophyllum distichum]|uniref:No apical meristem-associated C-terminal domain-containing protein n=1 Tax=Abeliophyllum distichum TaxID=126358 RepID=A0ABD1QF34_9LAMI
MSIIITAIGKLRGCIRQVEYSNPSGASEQDILNRTKTLLAQDDKFKKGFKFDHVWSLLKDTEKFGYDSERELPDCQWQSVNFASSQSESPTSESPNSASPGLSSFSLHINEQNFGGTSTERPIGVKKAKGKKKTEEENTIVIETIREQNRQLSERLTKGKDDRQQNYEIQMLRAQTEAKKVDVAAKKVDVAAIREENRVLLRNMSSISDPNLREFIRSEQTRIMQKKSEELAKQSQSTSNSFGQYFDDFEGSENDLPD